jgi:hypothetical protein
MISCFYRLFLTIGDKSVLGLPTGKPCRVPFGFPERIKKEHRCAPKSKQKQI